MHKEPSLVTVVIPTIKGREELLERAIQSIKNQTYKNIEIIIVDEGLPAPVQRNIGIKRSKGKYIAFLDDDDEWLPTKIEKQVEYMNKHPAVGLLVTWIEDKRFDETYIDKYPEIISRYEIFNIMRFSSTASYMVLKSLINKINGFDETLPSAQEYDLALRCSKYMNISCLQEILTIQHKSHNQISNDSRKKINGLKSIYKKYHNEIDSTYGIPLTTKLKYRLGIYLYYFKWSRKLITYYKKRMR